MTFLFGKKIVSILMKKFLNLQQQNQKVLPITALLSHAKDNESFYRISNRLYNSENLNSVYSLIAIREIVRISPLSNGKDEMDQPTKTFRWTYLIYSLASKKLTNDEELEMKINPDFIT